MAFQVRRGTNAERLTITPSECEPVYTTDTKKVFVGDGSTVGGIPLDTVDIAHHEKTLTQPNDFVVLTGNARWYPRNNISIVSIKAAVGTAPVGSNITLDIKKDGTSVTTLTILANENISELFDTVTSLLTTEYVTVDVTGIGSTTAGADLTVTFEYETN